MGLKSYLLTHPKPGDHHLGDAGGTVEVTGRTWRDGGSRTLTLIENRFLLSSPVNVLLRKMNNKSRTRLKGVNQLAGRHQKILVCRKWTGNGQETGNGGQGIQKGVEPRLETDWTEEVELTCQSPWTRPYGTCQSLWTRP